MANNIEGFTKIEFLLILVSIAYGYCIVTIFSNWSKLIRRKIWYWESLLWSINVFLNIIFLWYNAWATIGYIQMNISHFTSTLVPPIFIFIIVSLLFPPKKRLKDPETHFLEIRKLIFVVMVLYVAVLLLISNTVGAPQPIINYLRLITFVLFLLNVFIDSKILRGFAGFTILLCFFYFIFFAPI